MRFSGIMLTLTALHVLAAHGSGVQFTRQQYQTGVVWDQPVARESVASQAPKAARQESLLQSWSVASSGNVERLLDQKLIGAYLPAASITIETLDPHGETPRTRVDQPFNVRIHLSGLLSGAGFPDSVTKVRLEEQLLPASGKPVEVFAEGLLSTNGTTVLRFQGSALKADDPTKARGEERFALHTLATGIKGQTEIASAGVQVLPIASGKIAGISKNQEFTAEIPAVRLNLEDLYPQSETSLTLYHGSGIHGVSGIVVKSFTLDADQTRSVSMHVGDLADWIVANGTYTLALSSSTIYGKELLCDPITFIVKRPAAQDPAKDQLTAAIAH